MKVSHKIIKIHLLSHRIHFMAIKFGDNHFRLGPRLTGAYDARLDP